MDIVGLINASKQNVEIINLLGIKIAVNADTSKKTKETKEDIKQ